MSLVALLGRLQKGYYLQAKRDLCSAPPVLWHELHNRPCEGVKEPLPCLACHLLPQRQLGGGSCREAEEHPARQRRRARSEARRLSTERMPPERHDAPRMLNSPQRTRFCSKFDRARSIGTFLRRSSPPFHHQANLALTRNGEESAWATWNCASTLQHRTRPRVRNRNLPLCWR